MAAAAAYDFRVDIEAPDGARDKLDLGYSLGWHRARVETRQAGVYRVHVRVSARNHATEIHDIDLGRFSMLEDEEFSV